MVQGVETLLSGIGYGQIYSSDTRAILSSNQPPSKSSSNDKLDLSSKAQKFVTADGFQALKTIEKGIKDLQAADFNLAQQRLSEVRKRIGIANNLLGNASSDAQRNNILKSAQDIGRELNSITSQIRHLVGQDLQYQSFSLSLSNLSVSSEFAKVSSNSTTNFTALSGGRGTSYSETLKTDLTFLRVSATETSLSITKDENGLSIERSIKQTELIVSQLEVERTQTLSAVAPQPITGTIAQQLLDNFYQTAQIYDSFAEGVLAEFQRNNRILQDIIAAIAEVESQSKPPIVQS